jgi:pilus assembly protein FimV
MNRGNHVGWMLRRTWWLALAATLALLAGPAFALGLGQLTVKSQRGQPLLAEIAIVSSDPSELENLQARLASPETFARIGLEAPSGVVNGLQFTVALDPRGNPVIRVTSQEPVDESLLTFLVEVDWGQGRLVREYSALLDAPRTVAAPAQPPIEAPAVAPSNTIVREPEPAPPPAQSAPEAAAAAPAPAAEQAQAQEPAPPANEIAPTPPAAPPPAAAPERTTAQPVAATPGEYGPVKVGDTLGKIARSVDPDGHSLDQVMLALLRANPDAFIKGNVNLVKAGAVLRMPNASELSQYSAKEARAIVHEQVGQWREMRRPAEQPAAIAAADGAPAAAGAAQGPGAAKVADARLEIVPPSGKDARQAGTRSGIQAGGEGDMVELQQTKETLAARDAEVQELKSRVAELEKLQHEQQQLIAMKDDKLAQAQQALAARQAAAQAPASSLGDHAPVWPWAVGGLVLALALAWLFLRRRSDKPAKPVFDTSRLAASVPARPAAAPPPKPESTATPTWHAGSGPAPASAPAPKAAAQEAVPAAAAPGPATDASSGHDRIELARAYLDLGDVDTARGLLQEVADGGDAAARGEAARLLRDLV